MEEMLKRYLLALAGAYSDATGVPLSAIGSRALNHSRFFERLADPENSLTLKTYDRVTQWFSDNWPDKAAWPSEIERPEQTVAAA